MPHPPLQTSVVPEPAVIIPELKMNKTWLNQQPEQKKDEGQRLRTSGFNFVISWGSIHFEIEKKWLPQIGTRSPFLRQSPASTNVRPPASCQCVALTLKKRMLSWHTMLVLPNVNGLLQLSQTLTIIRSCLLTYVKPINTIDISPLNPTVHQVLCVNLANINI